jgi:hypothetical protein
MSQCPRQDTDTHSYLYIALTRVPMASLDALVAAHPSIIMRKTLEVGKVLERLGVPLDEVEIRTVVGGRVLRLHLPMVYAVAVRCALDCFDYDRWFDELRAASDE